MKELFDKLYQQKNLTTAETKQIAEELFSGRLTEAQISAFLIALKIKGETAAEMAGIAEVLREVAVPIPAAVKGAMCNCGTGGDRSDSFNVSTTAAFVLAAGGVPVAKTGNRSISSKSGSFDTCESLGIDILLPPAVLGQLLEKVNLAFIFAPHVHPKMGYVMPVRKALGTPTIMNLIGPLTNPVALDYQLMGTYRRELLQVTAETIQELGRKRAIVVNGANFMDEASLAGENHYALLENGRISLHHFSPEEVGLKRYEAAAIEGGGPEENAAILTDVLKGKESAYSDTVLLNSGLGFFAADRVSALTDGVDLAKDIIQSGAAYDKLDELLRVQEEMKQL